MPRFTGPVAVAPMRKGAATQAAAPQPRRAGPQRGPAWHAIQLKAARSAASASAAKASGASGLPGPLRAGIEGLSGLAMHDVRVHRNSAEPAKLGALAYTKGSEIHLGPGQERHLPHEAWHVVQQKQGRVAATAQLKGAAMNDSPALETEADAMGAKALAAGAGTAPADSAPGAAPIAQGAAPFQFRLLIFRPEGGNYQGGAALLHAMGQALEKQTMAAYTFVADELAGYLKGTAKFSFERYGCSSKERSNHYFNCLTKGSDAQKAAAAGYMIEDIVTATFGNKTGYTSQYAVKGARPDFLIEAVDATTGKKARGVVDITTEKEAGHILDKDFSTASYDYAAECLYPILDFKTGAKVVLDPSSAPTARQVQISRANEYVSSMLNNIWKLASHYDSFWYDFQQQAITVKKGVRTVTAMTDILPKDFKALDDNIEKLNKNFSAPLDSVAQIIGVAQRKYGLTGYPRSWTAPQKTDTTTTMISASASVPPQTSQQQQPQLPVLSAFSSMVSQSIAPPTTGQQQQSILSAFSSTVAPSSAPPKTGQQQPALSAFSFTVPPSSAPPKTNQQQQPVFSAFSMAPLSVGPPKTNQQQQPTFSAFSMTPPSVVPQSTPTASPAASVFFAPTSSSNTPPKTSQQQQPTYSAFGSTSPPMTNQQRQQQPALSAFSFTASPSSAPPKTSQQQQEQQKQQQKQKQESQPMATSKSTDVMDTRS